MSDTGHGHEIIIIRRHEEEEHESHSSAWKVAHADFMTAMMAFFLIMWLINVTDDEVRKGISEYFNPIHLSQGETELKGLNQPDPSGSTPQVKRGHVDTAPAAFNPVKLSQGLSDPQSTTEKAIASAAAGGAATAMIKAPAPPKAVKPVGAASGVSPTPAPGELPVAGAGDKAAAAAREQAAFQDPYAVLAKLAKTYAAEHASSADVVVGDQRRTGVTGGEIDRDPFDPVYWQLTDVPPAKTEVPGKPGTAMPVPAAPPDAAAPTPGAPSRSAFDGSATLERLDGTRVILPSPIPPPVAPPAASKPEVSAPAAPKADVTPSAKAEPPAASPAAAPAAAEAAAAALKNDIVQAARQAIGGGGAPRLSVEATPEGILIDLTDDADFSMFEVGSAIPNAKVVVLMEQVAKALATRPGNVIVRGHTDGRPFRSDLYDNWRLSAARAQMAHYMLTRGGLDDSRIVRIEGYADRDLKVPADPLAAENRRIEILLQEPKP